MTGFDIWQNTLFDDTRFAHGFFGRRGGVSEGIYASLNCGFGSKDDPKNVTENRGRAMTKLGARLGLANPHQVHGTDVAVVTESWAPGTAPKADGVVTATPGLAIGVLSADCAPILFADAEAGIAGAAHAGWRGALAGVAEATIAAMERLGARRTRIVAAVGPCITRDAYEVGTDFEAHFLSEDPSSARFFSPGATPDKRQMDLPHYVESRLVRAGIGAAVCSELCTFADPARFFSYRRTCHAGEADYGRALSAIALI